MPVRRIIVIGGSGSGKSTLAAALAERLALPYRPTDPIYWTDWRPTPAAEVRAWADAATLADAWVLDGNFDAERDLVWRRAELAIWLDLPFTTTLWRASRRNLSWWIRREKVWGGNPMTLSKALSGIGHAARSHGLKRHVYPLAFAEFPQLRVVRITSPRQLARWLARL